MMELVKELKNNIECIKNDIRFIEDTHTFDYDEVEWICKDFIAERKDDCISDYYGDSDYFADKIIEYSDSCINIYTDDIYKDAEKFSYWTEQALEDYGVPNDVSLWRILQLGEFEAYRNVLLENLNQIELYYICDYILELIDDSEEVINKLEEGLNDDDKNIIITTITDKVKEVEAFGCEDVWEFVGEQNIVLELVSEYINNK